MSVHLQKDQNPDHYVAVWGGGVFMTGLWIALFFGDLFVLYILSLQWKTDAGHMILATILIAFLPFLFGLGRRMVVNSVQIFLDEDKMRSVGMFGQKQEILYTDISSVAEIDEVRHVFRPSIKFTAGDPGYASIRADGNVMRLGELIERVLDKAQNVTEVQIRRLPDFHENWAKDPDWDLINRAKRRAEGNAAKA